MSASFLVILLKGKSEINVGVSLLVPVFCVDILNGQVSEKVRFHIGGRTLIRIPKAFFALNH